jgi:hypothetical protein
MKLLNRIKYKLRTVNFPELSPTLIKELENKGWVTLLAEAAALAVLCVVCYVAVIVTAIYMQGVAV